jgi:1A family penicillin-binding protein
MENFRKTKLYTHLQQIRTERKLTRPMLRQITKEFWLMGKKPLLYAFFGGVVLLVLIPILTYLYFIRDLSSKENIISRKNAGVILLDRNDTPFFTFYQAKSKKAVPLSQIPKNLQNAVIATEDRDFYEHPGFSIEGIGRAIVTNIEREELAQGGSTISQQLVKNTLLSQDKNFLRKYQELILALEIERRFTKDDILEMYLNTVYFGEGAFGVEDAARSYFGKTSSELTLAESALLAAILPAPSAYSPLTGDEDIAFRRQRLVLDQMQQLGYITEEEKDFALAQKITFNPLPDEINEKAPHFALMVKNELIDEYGEQRVAQSGFTVRTTLDLPYQEYAEQVVRNQVANLRGNKATNGAAIAINPKNGEILVLVGSHDWNDEDNGKINMVLHPRQPGSSFKPIVYAKALQSRQITAATQLEDKPITFPDGYKPRNYDNKFRGEVLTRFALANSLNIPALHVMERVGIPAAIEFAEDLGVTSLKSPQNYGLSLVLGAAEVPLIQMTEAFGTFANGGKRVTPTTILEIKDKRDKVIYTAESKEEYVMNDDVAFIISSILSDNQARQEVFGNSLTLSRPAAVKTGTTNDYKDALTIGYTPSLVVGVWVGNNDNTPMTSVAGSLGAAPIWRQIMERILRGTPIEQFRQPSGIVRVPVCKENGLRSVVATSSAYPEFFLGGTTPKRTCNEASPTSRPEPTDQPDDDNDDEQPTPTPTEAPTPTTAPTTAPTTEPTPTPIVIQIP